MINNNQYEYYEQVAILLIIINVLSFLALLIVIVIYLLRWKFIASFPMRISFYLCLSCMLRNLIVLMYPPVSVHQDQFDGEDSINYCIFESMVKVAFDLSSIIWTLIIIYSSYASVVKGHTLQSLELFYLTAGFLLPLLVALIPIFLHLYGYNIYYCWFDADRSVVQFGLKIGYYFGPLWIFFFLQMYLAYCTYKKLKEVGLEARELNIFKKILLFPIILLIVGLFPTADTIYVFVTGQRGGWLDAVGLICMGSYGMLTSLAYGLNPLIRDQIFILCGGKKEESSRRVTQTSSQSSNKTDRLAELIAM